MEDTRGKEETELPDRQQYDPAGLGDSDKTSKMDGVAMSSAPSPNEFPNMMNMMNMNPGLTNGMDYNQMMQFVSSNVGNGIASFNPMMGMSKMIVLDGMSLTLLQECQAWGWVQCLGCSGIWVARGWLWPG